MKDTFGIAVPEEEAELIFEVARATGNTPTWVARQFLFRGIAAFRRDGLLREPLITDLSNTKLISSREISHLQLHKLKENVNATFDEIKEGGE